MLFALAFKESPQALKEEHAGSKGLFKQTGSVVGTDPVLGTGDAKNVL